jgi:hypothetical protein
VKLSKNVPVDLTVSVHPYYNCRIAWLSRLSIRFTYRRYGEQGIHEIFLQEKTAYIAKPINKGNFTRFPFVLLSSIDSMRVSDRVITPPSNM